MKKITFLLTLMLVMLTACASSRQTNKTVAATEQETLSLPDFSAIRNSSSVTIYYKVGNRQEVKAENFDRTYYKINVANGTLKISNVKKNSKHQPDRSLILHITLPSLKAINNVGVLKFVSPELKASNFDLKNSGVANFVLNQVNCQSFNLDNSGVLTFRKDTNVMTRLAVSNLSIDNNGTATIGIEAGPSSLKYQQTGVMNLMLKLNSQGDISFDNLGTQTINLSGQARTFKFKNTGVNKLNGEFHASRIDLRNAGLGNTKLKVDCESLHAYNSGTESMTISGTADDVKIDGDGMTRVNVKNLNKY